MNDSRRIARQVALGGFMVLVIVGILVALLTSEMSGSGAQNVGSRSPAEPAPSTSADAPGRSTADATITPPTADPAPAGGCPVTRSNPGGDNSYIPDAPLGEDLGDGFIIRGVVRNAEDCRPLPGVRIQIWLATKTGSEFDNRTSVRTNAQGRYRVETAPTVPQFGEPNITSATTTTLTTPSSSVAWWTWTTPRPRST